MKKNNKYAVNEGQRFGALIAKKLVDSDCLATYTERSNRVWICECDCGGSVIAYANDIASGRVQHCNRCSHNIYKEPELDDLTGQTFGKLTVLHMMTKEYKGFPGAFWKPSFYVECSCGNRFTTGYRSLVSGFRPACNSCEFR